MRKAILLAAGRGTRLQPFTDVTPKCLIPICGVPLLDHWFGLLAAYGVTSVLINNHHLAPVLDHFVANSRTRLHVQVFHEPVLLGSAGTLAHPTVRKFVGNDSVFVAYADNLTDVDIEDMFVFDEECHDQPITVAVHETDRPHECGIVEVDEEHTITRFQEKPENPISRLANSGMYIFPSLDRRRALGKVLKAHSTRVPLRPGS